MFLLNEFLPSGRLNVSTEIPSKGKGKREGFVRKIVGKMEKANLCRFLKDAQRSSLWEAQWTGIEPESI